MCCMWLAENTGRKNDAKIAISAPTHNFIGLYLRNWGMYRQSEKNLLSSNISSTCPHNMVNFGLLAADIVLGVWGTPLTFNGFCVLAALLSGCQVVSVSQTLRVEQRVPPMFGWATIRLGIGPHSSLCLCCHTAYVLYYCNMVGWTWWDWSLILRTLSSFSALTLLVGSFDSQKPVPDMTYNVFSGTLNLTQQQ